MSEQVVTAEERAIIGNEPEVIETVTRIDKLTDEQKTKMKPWADMWIKIGLNTEPIEHDKAIAAMKKCYEAAELKFPELVIFVPDPYIGVFAAPVVASLMTLGQNCPEGDEKVTMEELDAILLKSMPTEAAGKMEFVTDAAIDAKNTGIPALVTSAEIKDADMAKTAVGVIQIVHDNVPASILNNISKKALEATALVFWHAWICGQFWGSWTACETFYRKVCHLELSDKLTNAAIAYEESVRACCYWWPNTDFCMYCDRPSAIRRTNNPIKADGTRDADVLHADGAKAIEWRSGWGLYRLNGVTVPEWMVMKPRAQWEADDYYGIANVEVKREFVRKYGIESLITTLGGVVIDKTDDGVYELIELDLKGNTGKWPYLKMINPSIGVFHLECVEQTIRTVKAALAWRNGTDVAPSILT